MNQTQNRNWGAYRYLMVALLLYGALIAFTLSCADDTGENGGALLLSLASYKTVTVPLNHEFSNPQRVTITGYTGHAMEPSISRDGNTLFFNSLNDGQDTSLYYASRVNATTFTSQGKITDVNGTPPHLDAVPSMDTGGKFYFISMRNYPSDYLNLFNGDFAAGTVSNLTAVAGDFYIESGGWLIMDAEISPDGNDLYYVNAFFTGGPIPEISNISVAHKSGANFIKDTNSSTIMSNVNTDTFLEYAPSISNDELEIFFTRLNLSSLSSVILIAKRNSVSDPFNCPEQISILTGFVEAPSLTLDKTTLYYHYQENGVFVIYKISR